MLAEDMLPSGKPVGVRGEQQRSESEDQGRQREHDGREKIEHLTREFISEDRVDRPEDYSSCQTEAKCRNRHPQGLCEGVQHNAAHGPAKKVRVAEIEARAPARASAGIAPGSAGRGRGGDASDRSSPGATAGFNSWAEKKSPGIMDERRNVARVTSSDRAASCSTRFRMTARILKLSVLLPRALGQLRGIPEEVGNQDRRTDIPHGHFSSRKGYWVPQSESPASVLPRSPAFERRPSGALQDPGFAPAVVVSASSSASQAVPGLL